ncbi:1-(5-phosphoribosyl)-5-[(5-phosphoribosylamino)methylideneamino]imidazole-4-carboxamide isomerase [Helicobacter sp. MIT 14-3879]|uniref:1-(5-phosphoribosyl)-5-[(5- phosphoribosylamino)methylideneamino]imidazole-4- carboxamide isomerase n=1 Tax=Helicobacter sp. MIT 14-3879 TaxID=2040649 RepID=UPI000E1FA1E9|nr:1-(5-phosphoribosyl)-5-[(5-phosphoribosylamino)methylideneamino]imidazole-4-carboxamide isomerase [Helicobacter sp. MIT 14-3879]RDU62860.1 1-(5-phosphoribosyl)-5-[(5-phosphoribosylamino)methylideneamino]imidazole-4-carboxamide isomerase [Helicobacter sp. MIT 14-3879]
MTIIPAIDLKDGQVVRLTKGDINSSKVYGEALFFAKEFEKMGAEWIHIVDLNGAFIGEPKNLDEIIKIRKSCNLKIELGGGIRDEDTIKKYIDIGINRVILGSVAIKNLDFTFKMIDKYPIVLGIDAKNGKVSTDGWANISQVDAVSFARQFRGSKLEAIICTDILHDGMLDGININFSESIAKESGINTIASGGFSSIIEIDKVFKNSIINGIIVGKAFYEGKVNLEEIFKKYT